jgi:hypothetical protein
MFFASLSFCASYPINVDGYFEDQVLDLSIRSLDRGNRLRNKLPQVLDVRDRRVYLRFL